MPMPTPTTRHTDGGSPSRTLSRSCWIASCRAIARSTGRARESKMSARRLPTKVEGAPHVEPITVRIPDTVRMTGLSKTKIYDLIASGEIEAAKVGRATVVFVASLNDFLRSQRKLPRRQIGRAHV